MTKGLESPLGELVSLGTYVPGSCCGWWQKFGNARVPTILHTLKSWFNESQFNEISRLSEQMPAPLKYFTIANLIQFSELHNLVNKSGLTDLVH